MVAVMMKELRGYFTQMTGYVVLALNTLLIGLFYVAINVFWLNPNYHDVLGAVTVLFFIVVPTLTMRLFADEIRNKTDQLLYTSPLPIWQIVAGKYLAATILFVLAMGITALFPVFLMPFGSLPVNQIVGAYVGYVLMGMSFIALGLFVSVLTESQLIAAIGTAGAVFLVFILDGLAGGLPADVVSSLVFVVLIVLGLAGFLYHSTKHILMSVGLAVVGIVVSVVLFFNDNLLFDSLMPRAFRWFSVFNRFGNFTMGIMFFEDIVFFVTFALVFIFLTVNVIEKRRWR
ncbi:MAG: ABC transporter permease subunit [Turicibacter sp.]|nr:ABC transporter permease subunit [Turicibacter sp.]